MVISDGIMLTAVHMLGFPIMICIRNLLQRRNSFA